jgi:hypothetical protein
VADGPHDVGAGPAVCEEPKMALRGLLNRTPEWQAWVYDNSLAAGVFRRRGNFNPRKAAAGHAPGGGDIEAATIRFEPCPCSKIYLRGNGSPFRNVADDFASAQ